ncbi:hypothetical protein QQ965_00590 [Candidatus Saccharibacteria bacterium oral taxon 955]
MSKSTHSTAKTRKPSALESFGLAFEYDVTWSQARKSVRERTI